MPGKRRKATWTARPLSWGDARDARTGKHVVNIIALVTDPAVQDNRHIRVVMTPALAREIADGLLRNADRAEDANTPVKILDRFPEV